MMSVESLWLVKISAIASLNACLAVRAVEDFVVEYQEVRGRHRQIVPPPSHLSSCGRTEVAERMSSQIFAHLLSIFSLYPLIMDTWSLLPFDSSNCSQCAGAAKHKPCQANTNVVVHVSIWWRKLPSSLSFVKSHLWNIHKIHKLAEFRIRKLPFQSCLWNPTRWVPISSTHCLCLLYLHGPISNPSTIVTFQKAEPHLPLQRHQSCCYPC
jgi:hypothetical protein